MKQQLSRPINQKGRALQQSDTLSLYALLKASAEQRPNAVAFAAPGCPPLTYHRLIDQLEYTIASLRSIGITRNDRVAIVLPNGPEMAAAFLAVACCATAAPLNPAYRASEFDFYLSDLKAKAVLVHRDIDSPVKEVARRLSLPIIELSPAQQKGAGTFTLGGNGYAEFTGCEMAAAQDVALVLHTSGTTSRPKIVPLTHANICTSARNIQSALELGPDDCCLNVMPLFHVHGLMGGVLASLTAGASIICAPGFYAPHFFQWLRDLDPTWYTAVPTLHQAILKRAGQNREVIKRSRLRFIRSSSAPLPPSVMADLEQTFGVPVIESFGMTEAALQITCNPLPPRMRKPGSVGVASGPDIALMDDAGNLLGVCEKGEIVIRGDSVIQGYEGDPAANQKAFINGWLRTGDQGYLDEDGYLFITGRIKEIINRGGEKISPREVDDVILRHPDVAQVVTFAVPDARLGEEVAAAVVLSPQATTTERAIRKFAAESLADFKVPKRVIIVEELPKGPTGKLRRIGLAKTLGLTSLTTTSTSEVAYTAPRTKNEEILAGIWASVLGVARVGVHDDFFQLGGDSLLAASILSRARESLGGEIPLFRFFDAPTVFATAREFELSSETPQDLPPPILKTISPKGAIGLSHAQQRLWLFDQMEAEKFVYNTYKVVRIKGALNLQTLMQAIESIVARHETLRTRFAELDRNPVQIISEQWKPVTALVDLSGCEQVASEASMRGLVIAEARRPMDLTEGPLLRTTMIKLGAQDHVFMVTIHHIVSDGWSLEIFLRELSSLYESFSAGDQSQLPELPIQYSDYVQWQRIWLEQERLKQQLSYWERQLGPQLQALQIPLSRPRPPVITFRGEKQTARLQPPLTQSLKELSQREGVTLFMTLLAAFQSLLHCYTGQEDIVVGAPIAGRNQVETEKLIGFFVNTLVLRTDFSGNPSFLSLLGRVRKMALEAYANQDVPFEKLVQTLKIERDVSRHPLAQVLIQLRNVPHTPIKLNALTVDNIQIDNRVARFELILEITQANGGLECVCEYNTDLFDPAFVTRLLGHFQVLLQGCISDPSQQVSGLPLLTEDERHQLILESNDTQRECPLDQCLHVLFQSIAVRSPDAIALVCQDSSISYHELNLRANQLAHFLRLHHLGPDLVAAVCLPPSLQLLVSFLAVVKSGAAYLPLDSSLPPDRLSFILKDANASLLITQHSLADTFESLGFSCSHTSALQTSSLSPLRLLCLDCISSTVARQPQDDLINLTLPSNLAYLMYTSGTTGNPKAISIVHSSIIRLVKAVDYAHLSDDDVFLLLAPISFDASTFEIWAPLLNAARLVIADDNQASLDEIALLLSRHQVTTLWLTAGLFHAMVDERLDALLGLKQLLAGGDVISVSHVRRLLLAHPRIKFINGYGPTESTTFACCFTVQDADLLGSSIPIGQPISNTRVYALNTHLNPVPIGIAGQLFIAGWGLARGYLNQPALTALQFRPDPFASEPGARMYATGDLVRYRSDSNIEFLGRKDTQVKIRGFRIEIGEIESILHQHPEIREAVVVAHANGGGQKALFAYTVAEQSPGPDDHQLREYLRMRLPDYMLPVAFITLDSFPLTPNGKIDRRALPPPNIPQPRTARLAARTPTQELLAGIWSQLLKLDSVGVDDNFFSLGGHSLTATQVISRLRKIMRVELSVREIFLRPTIAELARQVDAIRTAGSQMPPLPLTPAPRDDHMPLSFAQKRLWFLDQLEPANSTYNLPMALSIQGRLKAAALIQSINEIVRRHEALRTSFPLVGDEPVQHVEPHAEVAVPVVDLRGLGESIIEQQAKSLAKQEAGRPFELSRGPLLRATLVEMKDDDWLLLLTMHHIVSDGWSMGVFFDELRGLYASYSEGEGSGLRELTLQYADYAYWHNGWLQGEVYDRQMGYWRGRLEGMSQEMRLATDRARPAVQRYGGSVERVRMSEELSEAIREMSRREGASLYMTMLAGWKVVVHRHSGEGDIVVGSPIANRNREEIEGLIGFFVNTLVMRTKVRGGMSFGEVVREVREVALGAYANQDVPFERLVEEMEPERSLSRTPLFQVMFVLQNEPRVGPELGGLRVSVEEEEVERAKFDITVGVTEGGGRMEVRLQYKTDLYDEETIRRMGEHYERVMRAVVEDAGQRVGEIGILSEEEHRQVVFEWNETAREYEREYEGETTIQGIIERQAEIRPDATAVVCGDEQITYGELNRQANRLAHHLIRLGVGAEVKVGLCAERSVELIVGLLGIVKTGGVYVPLDPSYPEQRLAYMLEHSRAEVVLVGEGKGELISGLRGEAECVEMRCARMSDESDENPASRVAGDNAAYVIYTSGSTGRPKGAVITQWGALNHMQWMINCFDVGPHDRLLQKTPIGFDASVLELYVPLMSGAQMVMAKPGGHFDSLYLVEEVVRENITLLQVVPTMLWAIVEEEGLSECESLRVIYSGGEALNQELVEKVDRRARAELVNLYGPTEATIDTTYWRGGAGKKVAIGRPVSNVRVYVLGERKELVGVGVRGELHIAGAGVGRCYLNEARQTAESFIPNPFSEEGGGRLYRTGDEVRYRNGGELEYVGRKDRQVKVRGYRIEMGEIESILRQHPAIKEAVVVAQEERSGSTSLVAYTVGERLGEAGGSELREYLRMRLPDYMLPSAFITLDSFPLTPNGKIDRRALPPPSIPQPRTARLAARTPTQELLAGIWSQLLKLDSVSIDDNFFSLGGHSLTATQVTSRLRKVMRVELSVREIFLRPTIAELARRIDAIRMAGSQMPPLPLTPAPRDDHMPLSFAQKRLWFLDQLEPANSTYNLPMALSIQGRLKAAALIQSINEIVRRHEALRTSFPLVGDEPIQQIEPHAEVAVPVVDLRGLGESIIKRQAKSLAKQEAGRPFELSRGPLLRATLVQARDDDWVLLLTMHHIVSDGWSMGVFFDELRGLYASYSEGEGSRLRELTLQYADYAYWHNGWLQGEVYDRQMGYWRERLEGMSQEMRLATDRARPAVQRYGGSVERVRMSEELSEAIREMSRREGASLYMTMLAGWKVVLHRHSGEGDIVVGSPIANRNREEIEGLIGFFVNTLVMRTDLSGAPTFRELLGRVREVTLGAYANQDVPFEKLVEVLHPDRDLSRQPLFQAMFVLQNQPMQAIELTNLRISPQHTDNSTSKFDLTLSLSPERGGLTGWWEYNTDLFDPSTIRRMSQHYQQLLIAIVKNPDARISQIALLTDAERNQLLVTWNDTRADFPKNLFVQDLLQAQVARTPDIPAARFGQASLTYSQLNSRANQLAHYLRKLGVGPDVPVAICLDRSLEMVVGVLAILKAGGAYVPLDSSYPKQRLSSMLENAAAPVLVTEQRMVDRLPEHDARAVYLDSQWAAIADESQENPAGVTSGENLCYVIHTSGSTGKPKGVAMPHRALANMILWQLRNSDATAGWKTLQFASLSFDVSFQEMFSTLCSGGELVLIHEEARLDAAQLIELLRAEGVGRLFLPFVALQQLAEVAGSQGATLSGLREVITAGEQLLISRPVESFFEGLEGCSLHNHYGPSESHVVTAYKLAGSPSTWSMLPPVGRPVANTQIYLLDGEFQPVPIGVAGELYIGGEALARGYIKRPEMTAERFVPDPFSQEAGARLYKTGDQARYLADGNIEFLGRNDQQVKIRGHRVELGEVETVLSRCPGVRNAVVVMRDTEGGDKRLVAYLTVNPEQAPAVGDIKRYLKERLPEYMTPTSYVMMEEFPLTPSGKVDRRALPAPDPASAGTDERFVGPRTPVEELLVGIWMEVLRAGQVGINDNFFELGGHSLLATQVISRVRKVMRVELSVREIFLRPTIAELARQVDAIRTAGSQMPPLPLTPAPRDDHMPLSFAQKRLWFLDQLEPANSTYNLPMALSIQGRLKAAAIIQSINEIVRRHEALRTSFPLVGDEPIQQIEPHAEVAVPVVDLRGLGESIIKRQARLLARREAGRPFELSRGPLLRATLVQARDDDWVLLLTMHHIVSDGWSMGVFFDELRGLYASYSEGEGSRLRELTLQYADYAYWHNGWLQGEVYDRQMGYWRERLEGMSQEMRLATDRARPAVQRYGGSVERVRMSEELSEAIREVSRREGASLYMTMLAGWKVVLHRHSGEGDIVVGSPIANRNREEIEGLIGFFVNTLVMRTEVRGGMSFGEVVREVREVALGAYANQDVPFERLVEEMEPERSLSRTPLFQVMFVLQNEPRVGPELGGLRVSVEEEEVERAKFDITVVVTEAGGRMEVRLQYKTDLYDEETIRRMGEHYERVMRAVVEDAGQRVGEIGILSEEEHRQVVFEWNETREAYPSERSIGELFEEQAKQRGEAIALEYETTEVSYEELNRRANQMARYLAEKGVGPEVRVGICLHRGVEMIVGLLGILKAGGAYVPLDSQYPAERLRFIIEDAGAEVIVTSSRFIDRLPKTTAEVVSIDTEQEEIGRQQESNPVNKTVGDNLCYVIYTSGSTGRPKGVAVEQRSVVRLVKETSYVRLSEQEVILQYAPVSFDASTFEIWGALLNGGKLVVMREGVASLEELGRAVREKRVSTMWLTAGLFHQVVEAGVQELRGVKQLLAGGEVVKAGAVKKVLEEVEGIEVINGYGPTENTTFTCSWKMRRGEEIGSSIPIGRPIGNTRVYVMDEEMQAVGVGVAGELCVAGAGLARGYINQGEKTGEMFVPNPYGEEAGERMYRTGDIVRYRKDGAIEYLGRKDRQVKVRGYRIEMGEIESILRQHPAIKEAVVVAQEERSGSTGLVAYTVGERLREAGGSELREYLRMRLPDYMLPSAFITLDSFPLTPNGKIDRGRLPEPDVLRWEDASEYVAPLTPTQEVLSVIWCQLLKLDRVSINDNFFDIGGHSLLAMRAVSHIRTTFEIELPLRALFEASSLASLARQIEQERAKARTPIPPIERVQRTGLLPLSFAQQRLWFLDQLEPGSTAYNLPYFMDIEGTVDVCALERAFGEIVRRHEVLRAVFQLVDGLPAQMIRPAKTIELPVLDLTALPEIAREAEVMRIAVRETQTCFDLGQGPLIRFRLIRRGEQKSVLLINMHHAVSDGWSLEIMMRELRIFYDAFTSDQEPVLPQLSIQYADYAVWQRERLQGEIFEKQLEYWKANLEGLMPLELPTDRPRDMVSNSRGAVEKIDLSVEMTKAIKSLSRQHGATLFMTLLAAFKVLLYRYTNHDDIAVGSPIAGRNQGETENLMGFFVNTIVLRSDLSGNPGFSEVIERVREVALGAYANQEIPFEKIVEELQPERDLHRSPFFQIFFNMIGSNNSQIQLNGVSVKRRSLPEPQSKFDFTLYAQEEGGRIGFRLLYNSDLFLAGRMAEMLSQLEFLLSQVADEPERPIDSISLVTPRSRKLLPDPTRRLERAWHGSAHAPVQQHARQWPHRVAVADKQTRLTYEALDLSSNRIANCLLSNGIGCGDVVAMLGQRSASLVAALVGVMKAGAAFLILDPAYPARRLGACLEIVKPRGWLVVGAASTTSAQLAECREAFSPVCSLQVELNCEGELTGQAANHPSEPPVVRIEPDTLAYVAFTSGSTGAPKAILGTHAPLSHFLKWHCRTFSFDEKDRFCMLSGLSHDPLLRDIFTPLWLGAMLCIPDPEDIGSERLAGWMQAEGITIAHLTPALASALAQGGEAEFLRGLRFAFFGGDLLTGRDVINFRRMAPDATVVNFYGATETPQAMGYYVVNKDWAGPAPESSVPLGRGIEDAQLLLLNNSGGLAGIGELGEIAVRTPYLTLGYANDPELTGKKYLTNPFTGGNDDLLYKTGDLGRYLPNGNVVFVGRSDEQVKVRGFRIELKEVQAALQTHDGVRECAVVGRDYGPGDKRLVAYVVPFGLPPAAGDLRRHLGRWLPDYMMPAFFVTLDRLPLTSNGKLDQAALPDPNQLSGDDASYLAPRTATEELIAATWSQVLGVEPIGVKSNFFELGGHSLLAIRMTFQLSDIFHVDLPVRNLFNHPTLEGFAQGVDDLVRLQQGQSLHPIRCIRRNQELPLSFNEQGRLFQEWLAMLGGEECPPFYIFAGLHLKGDLNIPALEGALNEIIRRHEILRTTFSIDEARSFELLSQLLQKTASGRNAQKVKIREIAASFFKRSIRSRVHLKIPIKDIEQLNAAEREMVITRLTERFFDYGDPPLLRAHLLRINAREHILILILHHMGFDRWSAEILQRELATIYESFSKGSPCPLDAPPAQYVDFADWQQRRFQGDVLKNTSSYWKKQWSEFAILDASEIPFPRPKPKVAGSASALEITSIDQGLSDRLRSFARKKNITLYALMLAALDILLHLYTGKERIGIWGYFANRARPETENLIGYFANRHMVAVNLSSDPQIETVLDAVREAVIETITNAELPFPLLQMLQVEDEGWQEVIFQYLGRNQVMRAPDGRVTHRTAVETGISFDMINGARGLPPSNGLIIKGVMLPRKTTALALRIVAVDKGTEIALTAEYPTDEFLPSSIQQMFADFKKVIERILITPDARLSSFTIATDGKT